MDIAGIIGNSPQWRAFQGQLTALVQVVQDTNIRVRRLEAAKQPQVCKECQEVMP